VPTTLADLESRLRVGLGLTPLEAHNLLFRVVPTLQIAAISEQDAEVGGVNWAWGRAFTVGVAARFSHGQLFNPVGSGVILYVAQVLATTEVNSDVGLGIFNTALPNLNTAKSWSDIRRTGLPVAELRNEANVAQLGTELHTGRIGTQVFATFDFPAVIVLGEGQGLVARHSQFDSTMQTSFFWREEQRT
jgi:hypothetical protein